MDPIGRLNPIRTCLYMSVSSPSLFIEVPAPVQESDWSCICFVIGHVYVLPLSAIFNWIFELFRQFFCFSINHDLDFHQLFHMSCLCFECRLFAIEVVLVVALFAIEVVLVVGLFAIEVVLVVALFAIEVVLVVVLFAI